jgi:hypothetical protein
MNDTLIVPSPTALDYLLQDTVAQEFMALSVTATDDAFEGDDLSRF